MEDPIQQLNNRVSELESVFNKNSFSNREIHPMFDDFQGQLKVPSFSTTPPNSAGEIGQIRCVNGVLYICSAVDTWMPLLTSLSKFTQSFTADEDIATNMPVRVGTSGLVYYNKTDNNGLPGLRIYGTAGYYTKVAQTFSIPTGGGGITNVRLLLAKEGSPADNLEIAIQADSGNLPSGTDLATSSKVGSSITTSYVNYNFDFTLSGLASGTYWAVVRRSSAGNDGTDYNVNNGGIGVSVAKYQINTTWSAFDQGINMTITFNEVSASGRIKKALAAVGYQSYGFVGFTSAAISSGVTGNVATTGILDGFTGLTVGATYYLQNDGTIGTSAGTTSLKVGIALTSTILLINIPPQ